MTDTIKGFSIDGITRLIDWDGIANKPTIPTTVAELTDANDYVKKGEMSGVTASEVQGNTTETVASVDSKIETLIGTDSGMTMRDVAAEEVAKIVASADTKYDTLKEIADYISSDITSAATMANDIEDLKDSAHTHTNETVLDGITSDKVTEWNNKQAALTDTDGGYGQRIKAIEDELAAAIDFDALEF